MQLLDGERAESAGRIKWMSAMPQTGLATNPEGTFDFRRREHEAEWH